MLYQRLVRISMRMVVPRGIEPLIPPWKGGVLTAWPWDHVPTFGSFIICAFYLQISFMPKSARLWGTTKCFSLIAPFPFIKAGVKNFALCTDVWWWRWVELNYRSTGYEPVALTSEPHRHVTLIVYRKKNTLSRFSTKFL